MLSRVEKVFLERSKLAERYAPLERAVSVEVSNIYELGRIVALRFIEWVAENPNGVAHTADYGYLYFDDLSLFRLQ
jgi:glucosamine-6-phosphate deaminase